MKAEYTANVITTRVLEGITLTRREVITLQSFIENNISNNYPAIEIKRIYENIIDAISKEEVIRKPIPPLDRRLREDEQPCSLLTEEYRGIKPEKEK